MADNSSDRFLLLNELGEEFAARYRRGERPSLQEYIDRHPELADDIREFFPAMAEMEQAKGDRQELSAPAAPGPLPPLERLGDYRIIREIGRGGMGVVYEAEQISLGRHVALKVLPKQLLLDARTKQRFEREAKAAARLHHTNIVPVFGVGEHDGLPYYVMQFIQGLGLDEVLEELILQQPGGVRSEPGGVSPGIPPKRTGELRVSRKGISAVLVARSLMTGRFAPEAEQGEEAPAAGVDATAAHEPVVAAPSGEPSGASRRVTESGDAGSSSSVVLPGTGRTAGKRQLTYWQSVAHIGVQVADALEYAHRQGIKHRDIKPSNLLLDTTGTVWVTDFGLAKADDQQNLTHTGDILGTLRYMPPEAFDGKTDARGDVNSLGLTLYELLAFRPAFDEKERNRLIKQVTTAEPARLDRLNRALPRDLVTIAHKAIERDPGRRYPTAAELAADLQRFLDDQPIQARRSSAVERFGRWGRRNPAIAASLTALAVALVLGTAISSYFAIVANRHAQDAIDARGLADEKAAEAGRNAELAAANAALSSRLAAHLVVDKGLRYEQDGDMASALLWFAEPLAPGRSPSPEQEPATRERLAAYGRYAPRPTLTRMLFKEEGIVEAAYSSDGGRLLVASGRTAQIWDAAGLQLLATLEHPSRVDGAVFSPDGRLVVIAMDAPEHEKPRDRVWAWDVDSAEVLNALTCEDTVRSVAFSPDSRLVLVVSSPMRFTHGTSRSFVRTWDPQSGQSSDSIQTGFALWNGAFSPDGSRFLAAGQDVPVWDALDGRLIATLRHRHYVHSAAFSADGRFILTHTGASAVEEGSARKIDSQEAAEAANGPLLWDAATGKRLSHLKGLEKCSSASFSPDGKLLVSLSRDSAGRGAEAQVWNASTGELLRVLPHRVSIWGAEFSSDGRRLLTACLDQTVRVWDVADGQQRAILPHVFGITHAQFHPDGRRIVSGGSAEIRIWDLASALPALRSTEFMVSPTATGRFDSSGSQFRVSELFGGETVYDGAGLPCGTAIGSDGRRFVTLSFHGEARMWDTATGESLGSLTKENALQVSFTQDRRLIVAWRAKEAEIRRVADGELVARFAIPEGGGQGDFNPDGRLAVFSTQNTTRVLDTSTGQELYRLPTTLQRQSPIRFSTDGRRLATLSGEREDKPVVRVWDVATGKAVTGPMQFDGSMQRMHFSQDSRCLLLISATHAYPCDLEPWDLTELGITHAGIVDACFSPDGRLLATLSRDGTARLWNKDTGQPLSLPLSHAGPLERAAFSRDGRRLVTVTTSGEARIWDVASGQPLTPSLKHPGPLPDAQFSPDGRQLLTAGMDGSVRRWDLSPDPDAPHDDLGLLQLVQGHKLDPTGLAVPLDIGTARRIWQARSTQHPAHFRVTSSQIVAWHRREVEASLKEENWRAVLLHAEQALARAPNDPELWLARGQAYHRLFQGTHAVFCFAWAEGVMSPAERLDYHRRVAARAAEEKNLSVAQHHLAQALLLIPNDAELWYYQGRCHLMQPGQTDQAVGCFTQALTLRPEYIEAYMVRVMIRAQRTEWTEAATDLARVVELQPNEAQHWRLLAIAQLAAGDTSGYRQLCKDMIASFGKIDDSAANTLAWVCVLGPEAVAYLNRPLEWAGRGVALDPESADALSTLGAVLFRAGKYEEAARKLNASVDRSENRTGSAQDWLFLAMCNHRMGRAEEARRALEKVPQEQPPAEVDPPGNWADRMELQLLRREAEALLREKVPEPKK